MHKPSPIIQFIFGFGLFLLLLFSILFLFKTGSHSVRADLSTDIWSDYGTLIAGTVGVLFSILSAYFLMITLLEQRKNVEDQKNIVAKQQIETRFLNLLNIHRNNVGEMEFRNKHGKSVFIKMKDDFHDTYKAVAKAMRSSKGLTDEQLVDITYLTWFFGLNNRSERQLLDHVESAINDAETFELYKTNCLAAFKDQRLSYDTLLDANSSSGIKSLKLTGHQSRLGHYFRHLYQTVTYINNASLLSYDEKYNYIKTLRAQLTTHEQAIFLYNSLSRLGAPWEKGVPLDEPNGHLITKYNLVKNLPQGFTDSIIPNKEYPNVHFEFQAKASPMREQLEKDYRERDAPQSPALYPSRSE